MLFQLTLNIDFKGAYIKNNYYNILGSIHDLLNELDNVNNHLVSVSDVFFSGNIGKIKISIFGEDFFHQVSNMLLSKKQININSILYPILSLDYNVNTFDNELSLKTFSKIDISFKTPTFVKKEMHKIDINQMLPTPEVFLLSSVRKYLSYFPNDGISLDEVKKEISRFVIVSRFDISTKKVTFKKSTRAGVLGTIRYEILDGMSQSIKDILYLGLSFSKFAGLGSGNRLGLGQVGIYFS